MNVRENASWMQVRKTGGWMQDIAFMKTHLLRYFVVLAEERHFGRAAQRLFITQPPLSTALKTLEEDLGVLLVERDAKHVQLTPAGEAFLLEARKVLAQLQRAADVVRSVAQGMEGRLDVGITGSIEARRDICVPSDAINDRDCTFTARNKFACKNSHTIPLHGLSHRPSGRGLQSSGTTLQIQPRARISAASASAGESGCGPGISHHQSAGGCPHLMSYQTTNSPSVGTRSSVESISTRSITVSMIGYASP